MKFFLLISILLFLSISLSGCSYQKDDLDVSRETEDNNQIEEKQEEFIFQKNQDCLKYKDGLAKKLQEKNSSFGELSLEQIFYSPKINSCLYVEYGSKEVLYNKRLLDVLNDGPSSTPLEGCFDIYKNRTEQCEEFDKKVAEYKKY